MPYYPHLLNPGIFYVDDIIYFNLDRRTVNIYRSMVHHYLHYCRNRGWAPFPVTQEIMERFVQFLDDYGMSPYVVDRFICALRWFALSVATIDYSRGV